jgi:NAD(P)-dependent dehydrogenase (short-subunit alcohol dehydrogenase family)
MRNAYYLGRPASRWTAALSPRRPPADRSLEVVSARSADRDLPVALVTGGSRGLGRLIAEALAEVPFAVGLVARSADELAESVAGLEASGGVAAAVAADVSDPEATAAALTTLRGLLGPVELLVNNAGVPGPAGPAWEVDPRSWWHTAEVNLRGTFTCTRLVLPEMAARRRGRIINITSHTGVHRWPTASAYSVSKAAVVKFTENLGVETQRHGVSVFGVHPGLLPIGFSQAAMADDSPADDAVRRVHAWVRNELHYGRGTDPSRAVELVMHLASGRYDALSGRQLSVHDDLDEIVDHIDDVLDRELYVLGLQKLTA